MRVLFTLVGLAVFALIVSGQAALALSCLKPDAAMTYLQADNSDDSYRVVLGKIELLEKPAKRSRNASGQPSPEVLFAKARLTGKQLSKKGFTSGIDEEITVQSVCFASWCGGWPEGSDPQIFFVKQTDQSLTYSSDPCGSWSLYNPSKAEVRQIVKCHQGKSCQPKRR